MGKAGDHYISRAQSTELNFFSRLLLLVHRFAYLRVKKRMDVCSPLGSEGERSLLTVSGFCMVVKNTFDLF